MNQSESVKNLAAALVAAQKSIKGADLDAVNPHFKSRYATLTSVKRASAEALAANGLVVIQALESDGAVNYLETRLVHTSGEWVSGRMMLVVEKNTMQGMGSAITYAKRYSLAAITGVVDEDDDDGNGATEHAPKPHAGVARTIAPMATTGPKTPDHAIKLPKDYVAPVGRPDVKGKKLSELRLDQLQNAHSYWSTATNPPRDVPEYLQMLAARISELENHPMPDVPF